MKYNINIPIMPNRNIFQRIRFEKDRIDDMKTSGIYRINLKNESGVEECHIGVTKGRIEKRVKEHREAIKRERVTTALARLNAEDRLEIEFERSKKLAIYENFNHALKREAVEIVSENNAINCIEHALVEQGWREIIKIRYEYAKKRRGHPQSGPAESKSE